MSSNGVQGNARSGSQIMEQSGTNKDTKSTRKQQPLSLEDMVDILAKDPDLISMVERRMGEILSSNSHTDQQTSTSESLSRPVIQTIISDSAMVTLQPVASLSSIGTQSQSQIPSLPPTSSLAQSARIQVKHTSRLRASSRSRSHSPSVHQSSITGSAPDMRRYYSQHVPPPVKTVSFSSISTPHFHGDEEEYGQPLHNDNRSLNSYRRTRSLSPSPPPSPPLYLPSPPMLSSRSSNNSNAATFTTSSYTGESTASGDSSVSSSFPSHSNASTNNPSVRFSAMNPNPQLILDHNGIQLPSSQNNQTNQPTSNPPSNPRVSFTVQRSVSFEDQQPTSGSRNSYRSRSGLSSPSIEPALSPPLSSSNHRHSRIHFNSTIETITEAAARLRREHDGFVHESSIQNENTGSNSGSHRSRGRRSKRVVHFSAIRRDPS